MDILIHKVVCLDNVSRNQKFFLQMCSLIPLGIRQRILSLYTYILIE